MSIGTETSPLSHWPVSAADCRLDDLRALVEHPLELPLRFADTVLDVTAHISGEARFVWLHANGDRAGDLLAAAAASHGDVAWVVPVERVLDEGWFGGRVSPEARSRLGDVALVAFDDVALVDPDRPGPMLQSRHGSLTSAELHVPLLTASA